MPLMIRFSDGFEIDFDDALEMVKDFNMGEVVRNNIEKGMQGPGNHCDECGREFGYACIGPVRYISEDFGLLWLCKDCKQQYFKDEMGLNDTDLGLGNDYNE